MARDNSARNLTGFNIYHVHDKNQTVYYDIFTKTGYIITNHKAESFSYWQLRLPVSIIISAMIMLFNINPLICVAIGVAIYAVSTILFHTTFLDNLPINKYFVKPQGKGFFRDTAARYPLRVLMIITTLFFVLAIIMIVNQIIYKYEGNAKVVTYIFVAISIAGTIIMSYMTYLKKKENL